MFIKTILAVVMVFFAGCAQKEPNNRPIMFQSINEKEAILLQNGESKNYCPRCGMYLPKYYKTNHIASDEKKLYQYCSIHCLEEHLGEGLELKNPMVVDVTTLKFIDATKAYYVVGSRIRGTMSKISKYAFLNRDDAQKFQTQNGGEIMDFYKALEIAREDFKNYR